jgi:integrase
VVIAEGEFHASTDDEIARFEQRWPIGARERLAFALFVFTGRRASDVAKMSWSVVSEEPERCVMHGLRKAAVRRLAEAGCSANEIAAITGHASLEEVARYTRAAEQRKLARSAMDRLVRERSVIPFPGRSEELGIGGARVGTRGPNSIKEINSLEKGWRPVGDGLIRLHKPLIQHALL